MANKEKKGMMFFYDWLSLFEELEDSMIQTGKTKFKTELFSFSIQKNVPSVVILDETKIPTQYLITQEPKIDKRAIIADLKDGMVCDWAELSQTESLRIR